MEPFPISICFAMKLLCVLFALATLCAAQSPTFGYSQQFGRFGDQRTFRLKQVVPPVQESLLFPVQTEAEVPTPAIFAPLPVARAIANPLPILPVVEQPVVSAPQKSRRVVKKVRVAQEKPQQVDNVVFTENVETSRALNTNEDIEAEEARLRRLREEEEAKNAHYSFSSSVQDTIYDNAIQRSETRDGLALTGMYSYSDGFFRRTVHYQADQDGYRVVK